MQFLLNIFNILSTKGWIKNLFKQILLSFKCPLIRRKNELDIIPSKGVMDFFPGTNPLFFDPLEKWRVGSVSDRKSGKVNGFFFEIYTYLKRNVYVLHGLTIEHQTKWKTAIKTLIVWCTCMYNSAWLNHNSISDIIILKMGDTIESGKTNASGHKTDTLPAADSWTLTINSAELNLNCDSYNEARNASRFRDEAHFAYLKYQV